MKMPIFLIICQYKMVDDITITDDSSDTSLNEDPPTTTTFDAF
jgi:hypothetical protein